MTAMSTPYRVMYRLGFTPWDNGRIPEPLRALVESPEARLGCQRHRRRSLYSR